MLECIAENYQWFFLLNATIGILTFGFLNFNIRKDGYRITNRPELYMRTVALIMSLFTGIVLFIVGLIVITYFKDQPISVGLSYNLRN